MVHPQKRQLLRKLLDSTIGRIIELKVSICYELIYIQKYIRFQSMICQCWISYFQSIQHDMVSLDNLEYSYHDSNMAEIGVTPAEVELAIPSFVISDRAEQISYWQHQMSLATAKLQQASGDVRKDMHFISRSFHNILSN